MESEKKKVFLRQSDMDFLFFKNLSHLISEKDMFLYPYLYWVYVAKEGKGMMSSSKDIDYRERICSFLAAGGGGLEKKKAKQ